MAKTSRRTPKQEPPLKRTRTPKSRRRPITPKSAKLMALCDAKRVAAGMNYADVGRAAEVGRSDASAALRLREEPTKRTLRALVGYFALSEDVREISGLSLKEHEVALLIEIEDALTKAAEKIGALRRLRDQK